MKICVIGAGHVGLVTGVCFADLGHEVVCVDRDRSKLRALKRGEPWFYEPGLAPMLVRNMKRKKLSFSESVAEGVRRSQVIFIAVGTPPLPSGDADLSAVEQVVREIARAADGYRLIVEKSTVPVETGKRVQQALHLLRGKKGTLDVASNPEFLREGSAVEDFLHPERIVIGVESKRARILLEELYEGFGAPLVVTDIASAELIKHASNAFLSTKISFVNALSVICDRVGADVEKVALGMGMDSRIGPSFLRAGVGYGGFCFPKDLEAFIRIAEKLGYDFRLLKATQEINEEQKRIFLEKVSALLWNLKGKKVAVLGLAFKPDTDDLRFAPALDIIASLLQAGAKVRAFDPQAMKGTREILGDKIQYAKDEYDAVRGADCLLIFTEWKQFKEMDLKRIREAMHLPVIVDGRNLLSPEQARQLGFRYVGMGRG